jgi:hypothetical protein
MTIVQAGSLNVAAIQVPGVVVQIIPPGASPVSGVPTDILGIVGTAIWGPVNAPTIVGNYSQYKSQFGDLQNRLRDMGTAVAVAIQQGCQNFRCVRVTDGTDAKATKAVNGIALAVTAASSTGGSGYTPGTQTVMFTGCSGTAATATCVVSLLGVPGAITITSGGNYSAAPTGFTIPGGSGLTPTITTGSVASALFSALYTGSLGNTVAVALAAGQAAGSWNLAVSAPGRLTEIFDGITGTGAAFWEAVANAVNNGLTLSRGPSKLITAAYQNNPAAAAAFSVTLTGGTDGAAGMTDTMMLGADGVGSARTGMYALRGTGAAVGMLADCLLSTTWTTQDAFGLSEGIYKIMTGPAGDTIANAIATIATAGLNDFCSKLMFGDWIWWNDPVSQIARFVSPQGFTAGRLANLAPMLSTLNQQSAGVAGTQASMANYAYSQADLLALITAGIDLIANPGPAGVPGFTWWSGTNTSANPAVNGDNYPRLTFFIARNLNAWAGQFIGQLQTATQRAAAWAALDQFLMSLWQLGVIGSADSTFPNGAVPFSIVLDDTNNPPNRVALGFEQADIQITYLSVIRNFIANIQAGQSVQITPAPTA